MRVCRPFKIQAVVKELESHLSGSSLINYLIVSLLRYDENQIKFIRVISITCSKIEIFSICEKSQ